MILSFLSPSNLVLYAMDDRRQLLNFGIPTIFYEFCDVLFCYFRTYNMIVYLTIFRYRCAYAVFSNMPENQLKMLNLTLLLFKHVEDCFSGLKS